MCCGLSNRGVALYNGKVFVASLDAHLRALDAKTGKEVWKTKVAEWKEGYSITSAPTVANGVLMTGMTGGEYGVRGFVAGYDPETGKQLWRRHMTAGPGEKGHETWPRAMRTCAAAPRPGSRARTIPSSTSPTGARATADRGARGWRPGDNLWVASVVAMRPKTGEIVWHYQWTPAETYDFDGNNENVLADMTINGVKRKVLLHADRNGFLYVLDRTNGQFLAGNAYVPVNWAKPRIDPATGRPEETDVAKRLRAGEKVEVQPRWTGGKNWFPMAFNPQHAEALLPGRSTRPSIYQVNKEMPGLQGRASATRASTTRPRRASPAKRGATTPRSIR